jgi:hypothetical protein
MALNILILGNFFFFLTNHSEATAPQQNLFQNQKSLMYKQKKKGREKPT